MHTPADGRAAMRCEPSLVPGMLHTFLVVAGTEDLGEAANSLGIGVPELGRQLQRLEYLLDVTVLERTAQKVRLTPAGALLVPHAERVLEQNRILLRAVRSAAGGGTTLTVAVSLPVAPGGLMDEAVRCFRAGHENVRLSVIDLGGREESAVLADGGADVVLTTAEPAPDRCACVSEVLVEEDTDALPHPGRPWGRPSGFYRLLRIVHRGDDDSRAVTGFVTACRTAARGLAVARPDVWRLPPQPRDEQAHLIGAPVPPRGGGRKKTASPGRMR
ncbi:LysR family transcriptional regulator [Streptomyces sp. VRA16 Mangrove soil]|uniref:LysR family transcriptional regulator n=1 Tax=Streptomyces sp. VRA16 Mangrove soil TaxID=2817434 RepID=UPI001A9F6414|nr:LysR family transcriptional regulator [Streptomyces sp. VRA16 Mangrove soil]MBO1331232.1 LysR family transcriptional regulator [Streptomyces sp. VRA16 Mangrove soil]